MSFTLTIMTRAAAECDGLDLAPYPLVGVLEPDDTADESAIWFVSEASVREFLTSCPPRRVFFRCGPGEDERALEQAIRGATLH